ncbi:amino acid ABC transporter permease [Brevibacterium luteolum]|nr:amino acid ABC transporter permease [Brevibacterium luteolum]
MKWSLVASFMFHPDILRGLGVTLQLTLLSMVIGLSLGIVLAVMRLSRNRLFSTVSWLWVWFFRGVPPLVQMIFWFNLATLIPNARIGVPFTSVTFFSWDMNQVMTSFSAAILGLALTESAYAAEMIRAGIQAVPSGQVEAANALGFKSSQVTRRIVLPQALKIVLPPIGNDLISMLKFTSLVSVLATPDLLYSAQMIYARNYQTIPLLLVATVWYLVLTTLFTAVQHAVENKVNNRSIVALPRLSLLGVRAGGSK